VHGQVSSNASGGDATGSGGSASYSIGQPAYTYVSGSNGNTNQGVQQPYEIYTIAVDELDLGIDLSAFPNPTSDILNLQFGEYENYESSFQLVDQVGKLIQEENISNKTTSLDLSQLVSGIYYLSVRTESQNTKTFKIIKK
jgi:hypothetical protein